MISYVWPLALAVFCNTIYQICSKGTPEKISPFASLAITYFVSSVFSLILHYCFNPHSSFLGEILKTNWTTYVFGIILVGLELGFIYAYKAGWQVSTFQIVQAAFLAISLIFIGYFLYNETITWNKCIGITICLVGLYIVNIK